MLTYVSRSRLLVAGCVKQLVCACVLARWLGWFMAETSASKVATPTQQNTACEVYGLLDGEARSSA